ncbi:MAG: ferritin-like domain-containing protein [Actinomycetes bacterium]|jgi:hypothetical protein|nr:MAG: DUF4439 domain-containing protein [Actinomycetota bacterium]
MVDALEGLRKALEAEHAAVYAYGVVGARTDGARRREATAAFDAHRARRDRLRELIISRGGTPTEPAAGYDLPFPVRTAEDCVRLAALVEERVTAAYLELVAVDDASLRGLAASAMQESTTRAYRWRPQIPDFPGWK